MKSLQCFVYLTDESDTGINNNNNTQDDIYSAVIMTTGHCESSLGSFDECRTAHKRPSTLRPSHLTWAVSPPVGSYRLQPPIHHRHLLLLLSPKADTHLPSHI